MTDPNDPLEGDSGVHRFGGLGSHHDKTCAQRVSRLFRLNKKRARHCFGAGKDADIHCVITFTSIPSGNSVWKSNHAMESYHFQKVSHCHDV